jgi:hypothetical protein
MPITPFLNGERFDDETRRALGVAFEMTCIALRVGDCADDIRQVLANKIIALAKAGERNPDRLCEEAVEDTTVGRLRSHAVFGIKQSA